MPRRGFSQQVVQCVPYFLPDLWQPIAQVLWDINIIFINNNNNNDNSIIFIIIIIIITIIIIIIVLKCYEALK